MGSQSETLGQLAAALAAVQARLPAAVKDKQNPHLRNRYADLGSVWDACRDLLPEHGLAIVQRGVNEGGVWGLETVLAHASGEWIAGVVPLLCGANKGTSEMQALGSAMTYARRYGLAAILGVVSEDDDDGHAAGRREAPQRAQEPRRREAPANGHPVTEGPPPARQDGAKPWPAVLGRAVKAMAEFDGEPADDAADVRRRARVINDLITQAMEAGKIGRPAVAKDDNPEARDSRKSADVARKLYDGNPAWVKGVIKQHLDRLARQALGPGAS